MLSRLTERPGTGLMIMEYDNATKLAEYKTAAADQLLTKLDDSLLEANSAKDAIAHVKDVFATRRVPPYREKSSSNSATK